MKAEARSSERRRSALIGASPEQARRPAGELLARIPWDGQRLDAVHMSAARFLGALPG